MISSAETMSGPDELVLEAARLLMASDVGRALPPGERGELWSMSRRIAAAVAPRTYGARARDEVDFQAFVRALLGDLFRALSSATTAQLRSFHELLRAACKASAQDARLLSTLVLLGLQRIVIPSGEVDARMSLAIGRQSSGQGPRIFVGDALDTADAGQIAVRFHSDVMPLAAFASPERVASWDRLKVED